MTPSEMIRLRTIKMGLEMEMDGMRLTGFFLERSVLTERRADVLAARERLVDRLKRAVA